MKRAIPKLIFLITIILTLTLVITVASTIVPLGTAAHVLTQTGGGFTLGPWILGGDSMTSAGGNYETARVIGQITPRDTLTGLNFELVPGLPRPVPGASARQVYLPAIARASIPPTPTPLPDMWVNLGDAEGEFSSLAINAEKGLFATLRQKDGAGGGIYNAQGRCINSLNLVQRDSQAAYALAFKPADEDRAIAGVEGGVSRSLDGGQSWMARQTLGNRVLALSFINGEVFAGTQENGIYVSTDDGATWSGLLGGPKNIGTFTPRMLVLWIGTEKQGIWQYNTTSDAFNDQTRNLAGDGARTIWDIVFDGAGATYYLATFDGIFFGDGNSDWQRAGLDGQKVRSLTLVPEHKALYAGLQAAAGGTSVQRMLLSQQGVWSSIANGSGWDNVRTVRDLLYDEIYCNGLLAATNEGIWVLR